MIKAPRFLYSAVHAPKSAAILSLACLSCVPCALGDSVYPEMPGGIGVASDPWVASATSMSAMAVSATSVAYETTGGGSYADDPARDPAIGRLAERLGKDPIRIYEWVRNNIRTEIYAGCSRGASLTLLEQAGNDVDQCALLGALFRASGSSAVSSFSYSVDKVVMPESAVGSNVVGVFEWLGVHDQAGAINSSFNAHITAVNGENPKTYRLTQMSVVATLADGRTVRFFPSLKPRKAGSAVNWDTYSGYVRSAAITAANASATGSYSPAISSQGLRAYLTARAVQASNAVSATPSLQRLSGAELVGGGAIDPEVITKTAPSAASYPANVSIVVSGSGALSNIPESYQSRLKITMGNAEYAFWTAELQGKTLGIEFDSAGVAILKLDGVEKMRESSGDQNASINVAVTWLAPADYYPGTAIASQAWPMKRQNAIAVFYSFGQSVLRLQSLTGVLSEKEQASAASVTVSDRLQLIGSRYVAQHVQIARLGAVAGGSAYRVYALAGFCFVESGRAIINHVLNAASIYSAAADADVVGGANAGSLFGATMEGTAIQQTNGSASFGAPSLLDYALSRNQDGYYVDTAASFAQLRSQNVFLSYTSSALAEIQAELAAGYRVFMLKNGRIDGAPGGAFAWLQIAPTAGVGGHVGAYNGGISSDGVGSEPVDNSESSADETETPDSQDQEESTDPVDLTTGAFLRDDVDLALGGEGANGLHLGRNYNTARRLSNPVGLGNGWTHSYDLRLAFSSPGDFDLERSNADEVLPFLIAARLIRDILGSESSARGWMMASTAAAWANEQLINSRVHVAMGARSLIFVKRPDGTFVPPAGIAATLTPVSDGYNLAFRLGDTIHFKALDGSAAAGKFTWIRDPFGNTLTAAYDSGRLQKVTDAYNRYLTFNYDGTGRLSSVVDSTQRSVQYGRTAEGHLTVTDPMGNASRFEMDSRARLTKVVDARNRTVVENVYDDQDRVYLQNTFGDATNYQSKLAVVPGLGIETDPLGKAVRTYFDGRGRKIFVVDQLGHLASWNYDGADRLVKSTSPAGRVRTYAYNTDHELIQETNPAGNSRTIAIASDASAGTRTWTINNFEGKQTVTTYKLASDRVTKIVAPGGVTSTFDYDEHGRLISKLVPPYSAAVKYSSFDAYGNATVVQYPQLVGSTVTYSNAFADILTYNALGDVTTVVDRRGVETDYDYNKRRQPTKVTQDPSGVAAVSWTFYDAVGDVDYTVDPSNRQVDYEHDALGHLLRVSRGPVIAPATTVINTYDRRQLLSTSKDALGNTTTYGYDDAQRLLTVKDPLNRITTYGYDDDGLRQTVKTPMGYITTTLYDDNGNPDSVTDAESRLVDYGYDKDGRRTSLANRRNLVYSWVYDDATRTVTARTPTGKSTITVQGALGRPQSVTEPSLQVSKFTSYDPEGHLLTQTQGVGTTVNLTTTYTYYDNGLLNTVTEGGRTSTREYDDLNRLKTYKDGESDGTVARSLGYVYTASGELKQLTYPGGNVVTYTYDDFGRLWTVKDWANRLTTYTYDKASRLTRIDRPNGTWRTQEYDAASQLRYISDYKSDGSILLFEELTYDNDGRIKTMFVHPKPAAFTLAEDGLTYDDDNRLLTWTPDGGSAASVVHDADGNMTSGPLPSGSIGTYVYDSRNRLTSAGGTTYRYNPDGLRVAITGTGAATFAVDPNAALSRVLQRTQGGTTTSYVYGLGLLYEDTGGSSKMYHFNHLGSTLALSAAGGTTVTDTVRYSPFGRITERSGSTATPFLLHGEMGVMTDANGLNYMRARYYNWRIMRFVNADPIGFDGGLNWYAAFLNDPISNVDPSGLDTYEVNRRIGGGPAMPGWDIVSHTYVFTQDSKGIVTTYSWGNTANPHGWSKNQSEDVIAAFDALDRGYAKKVGDSSLDKYVEASYNKLNDPKLEHKNGGVYNNCKTEAGNLVKGAKDAAAKDEENAAAGGGKNPDDAPKSRK